MLMQVMSNREALTDRTNASSDSSRILFSSCKGETHTVRAGFKQLSRRLRTLYRTDTLESKDDFTLKSLSNAAAVVFGNPQQKFTAAEFETLKQYVGDGGSILILSSEGGEARSNSNINYLIEEFGINVNSDSVIRLSHDKYLHPKEALIVDGILNREIAFSLKGNARAANKTPLSASRTRPGVKEQFDGRGAALVYARGATLTVQKPSVPFLATGQVAYPMHRPIGEPCKLVFVIEHTDVLLALQPLNEGDYVCACGTACRCMSSTAHENSISSMSAEILISLIALLAFIKFNSRTLKSMLPCQSRARSVNQGSNCWSSVTTTTIMHCLVRHVQDHEH